MLVKDDVVTPPEVNVEAPVNVIVSFSRRAMPALALENGGLNGGLLKVEFHAQLLVDEVPAPETLQVAPAGEKVTPAAVGVAVICTAFTPVVCPNWKSAR